MRISYTFRNVESSDAIKNYASEKITKLKKYCRGPLHAELTFSVERHLHRTDITVTADGHQYAGHDESEDMYATIDLVIDKIQRQLRDAKSAATDKMRHSRDNIRGRDN